MDPRAPTLKELLNPLNERLQTVKNETEGYELIYKHFAPLLASPCTVLDANDQPVIQRLTRPILDAFIVKHLGYKKPNKNVSSTWLISDVYQAAIPVNNADLIAMFKAVMDDSVEEIMRLDGAGCNLLEEDANNISPLLFAIYKNKTCIPFVFKCVVANHACPENFFKLLSYASTILTKTYVAEIPNAQLIVKNCIIDLLNNYGEDMLAPQPGRSPVFNEEIATSLLRLISAGQVKPEIISHLFFLGANPFAPSKAGDSAITIADEHQNKELLELYLPAAATDQEKLQALPLAFKYFPDNDALIDHLLLSLNVERSFKNADALPAESWAQICEKLISKMHFSLLASMLINTTSANRNTALTQFTQFIEDKVIDPATSDWDSNMYPILDKITINQLASSEEKSTLITDLFKYCAKAGKINIPVLGAVILKDQLFSPYTSQIVLVVINQLIKSAYSPAEICQLVNEIAGNSSVKSYISEQNQPYQSLINHWIQNRLLHLSIRDNMALNGGSLQILHAGESFFHTPLAVKIKSQPTRDAAEEMLASAEIATKKQFRGFVPK